MAPLGIWPGSNGRLVGQQRVKMKSNSLYSFPFNEMARPGETRTPDPLLRRHAIQNSKSCFWSLTEERAIYLALELDRRWTENAISVCRRCGRMAGYSSGIDSGRVADDSPRITASADNSQKTRSPKWRFTDRFVVVTQFRRRNRTQFPALGWMFRRCD